MTFPPVSSGWQRVQGRGDGDHCAEEASDSDRLEPRDAKDLFAVSNHSLQHTENINFLCTLVIASSQINQPSYMKRYSSWNSWKRHYVVDMLHVVSILIKSITTSPKYLTKLHVPSATASSFLFCVCRAAVELAQEVVLDTLGLDLLVFVLPVLDIRHILPA
jgi:hypothetical protein